MIRRGGLADLVLIAVKGPNTKYAADIADQLVCRRDGAVVSLQNGMGNVEILQVHPCLAAGAGLPM